MKYWLDTIFYDKDTPSTAIIMEHFNLAAHIDEYKQIDASLVSLKDTAVKLFETRLGIEWPMTPDSRQYLGGIANYIADRQWGETWVSRNLFVNSSYTESISTFNSTWMGYIEIDYFYRKKFSTKEYLDSQPFMSDPVIIAIVNGHIQNIQAGKEVLFDYEMCQR
jgi:hypothetical protein